MKRTILEIDRLSNYLDFVDKFGKPSQDVEYIKCRLCEEPDACRERINLVDYLNEVQHDFDTRLTISSTTIKRMFLSRCSTFRNKTFKESNYNGLHRWICRTCGGVASLVQCTEGIALDRHEANIANHLKVCSRIVEIPTHRLIRFE